MRWFQAFKALAALCICALAGVNLGINTWLELYHPSPFDRFNDVDNPPWPFTNIPWNIAVSGITIFILMFTIVGDFVRQQIFTPAFVIEIFWLSALCTIWVINTVVTVHTVSLYTDYCDNGVPTYRSDICSMMYPHFRTSQTLGIATTAAVFAYSLLMLLACFVNFIRARSQSSESAQLDEQNAHDGTERKV